MSIAPKVYSVTRNIYEATNLAGRLHWTISEQNIRVNQRRSAALADRSPTRLAAIKRAMAANVDTHALWAAQRLKPAFDRVDLVFGRNFGAFDVNSFPLCAEDLRDGLGVLGSLSIVRFVAPARLRGAVGVIANPVSSAAFWAGLAVGLACRRSGAPWQEATVRGFEIITLPAIRIKAQLLSLVGFAIKAIPLALAALMGAAVGFHRGLHVPVYRPQRDERGDGYRNTTTLRGLPLSTVPDEYFIALNSAHAFDIREIAQYNARNTQWMHPWTHIPIGQMDKCHIIGHASGVGQQMLVDQYSKKAAARRVDNRLIKLTAQLADGLGSTANAWDDTVLFARFRRVWPTFTDEQRADYAFAMTSDTGEQLHSVLRPRDPARLGLPQELAGGNAGKAAYFQERYKYVMDARSLRLAA